MRHPSQWQIQDTNENLEAHRPFHEGQIAVRTSQTDKGRSYQAVDTTPIEPYNFLEFLNQISPVKIEGPRAITADWEMPDQIDYEAKRLQNIHRDGLKEFWTLFAQHRHRFMRALAAQESFDDYQAGYSDFTTESDTTRNAVDFIQSRQDHIDVFHGLRRERRSLLEHLLNAWRKIGKRKKGRRGKPEDNAYVEWSHKQLQEALKYVKSSMLQEEVLKIAIALKGASIKERRNRNFRKIPHPETGETLYVDTRRNGAFLHRASAAIKQETIESNGYVANVSLSVEQKRLRAKVHIQTNQKSMRARLFPLMQWTRDNHGERMWNYDFLDEESFATLQPHLPRECSEDYDKRQINPLVGLMAAATQRPEVTRTWPSQVRLPQGKHAQIVGPAQIPVFAAMKEKEIIQGNSLLSSIEEQAE